MTGQLEKANNSTTENGRSSNCKKGKDKSIYLKANQVDQPTLFG